MAAYTITLPPATQAEIDGLIADLRTLVQKYSTLADTVNTAVPALQMDVKTATDAVKAFKFSFSGPMGIHGQST
jgi:t-SNARE complex subunit (syntaxin)